MAEQCSVDFVPGAACHWIDVDHTSPVVRRLSHFFLPDFPLAWQKRFAVASLFAGRAGFGTQAVVGRFDPNDHVERYVVLPPFFEKAWWGIQDAKGPMRSHYP